MLADAGYPVASMVAEDGEETHGINDRVQLAAAEAELRRRTTERWLREGVTMVDPDRTYLDTTVELGRRRHPLPRHDPPGRTVIGEGAEIGPDTRLVDCVVGDVPGIEQAVARDAEVGEVRRRRPFAVLEPGAHFPSGPHRPVLVRPGMTRGA